MGTRAAVAGGTVVDFEWRDCISGLLYMNGESCGLFPSWRLESGGGFGLLGGCLIP